MGFAESKHFLNELHNAGTWRANLNKAEKHAIAKGDIFNDDFTEKSEDIYDRIENDFKKELSPEIIEAIGGKHGLINFARMLDGRRFDAEAAMGIGSYLYASREKPHFQDFESDRKLLLLMNKYLENWFFSGKFVNPQKLGDGRPHGYLSIPAFYLNCVTKIYQSYERNRSNYKEHKLDYGRRDLTEIRAFCTEAGSFLKVTPELVDDEQIENLQPPFVNQKEDLSLGLLRGSRLKKFWSDEKQYSKYVNIGSQYLNSFAYSMESAARHNDFPEKNLFYLMKSGVVASDIISGLEKDYGKLAPLIPPVEPWVKFAKDYELRGGVEKVYNFSPSLTRARVSVHVTDESLYGGFALVNYLKHKQSRNES